MTDPNDRGSYETTPVDPAAKTEPAEGGRDEASEDDTDAPEPEAES